ncbi:biopolymer transporter ExbD [Ancylomarina euxinus]|uniref:Biopolymer transporter ExbD n=1 Tax=Ancylomarina euxinus TaxID=2283627 RepID=A0A425Y104_9BACT|nr:biopolymer transporter ExbD [Ancylomarina euxinus]MCZ4693766.1 biopolymer transporter ExbD [Ancylomarina euxinus]MUP15154.1 biopolymer transporter ExbD [Ancylomarina euxinus]RRG21577.1 biopolymer transporter ExbD [Ancylomarina euxinus]
MARKTPEINSSSMADIAFLLLIFFLVTTTMDVDTGIYKKLPPIPDKEQQDVDVKVKKRNVFSILVNRNNELLVNGEILRISDLREKTKEFFMNPSNLETLPEKALKNVPYFGDVMVSKGLISLQNDRGTQYATYIRVQDELAAASRELKDEKSMQKWGKKYDQLDADQQEAVRKYIPVQISEAEPRNTGGK